MWIYSQATGRLSLNGEPVGTGYSGKGTGLNNPEMQDTADVGPIPQGTYTIGPAFLDPGKGPVVMRLTPNDGTKDFGRSGFLMHGDNQLLNHSASEGCIVTARGIREVVAASDDRQLTVIE